MSQHWPLPHELTLQIMKDLTTWHDLCAFRLGTCRTVEYVFAAHERELWQHQHRRKNRKNRDDNSAALQVAWFVLRPIALGREIVGKHYKDLAARLDLDDWKDEWY